MKTLLTALMLLSTTAYAQNHHQQHVIIPTIPGHVPNPVAPRIVVMPDGKMYQTVPGANIRDGKGVTQDHLEAVGMGKNQHENQSVQ